MYHLAVVKFQMKEKEIAKKLESLIHILPNGFAIVTAVFLSVKHAYAPLPEHHLCWIGVYPQACIGDPDIECVRGGQMTPGYAKNLAIIPLFIVYFFVVLITITIVYEIAKQKRKSDKWRMRDMSESCCCQSDIFGSFQKRMKRGLIYKRVKTDRRIPAKSNQGGEGNSNLGKNAKNIVASSKGASTNKTNSTNVRFSNQDITSELRSKIAVGSRSGNKDDHLAFDIHKVKKKIRRESGLVRDAPIVLSNNSRNKSKDGSTTSAQLPLRNSSRRSSVFSSTTHSKAQKSETSRSSMATRQCLLYHMNFLVCFCFPVVSRIYGIMGKEAPFALLLLARIFMPLNGFFLILVYSRPHVKALRSQNQDLKMLEAFVTVFKAGADNDLGESQYCVDDEEGIDAPRLTEAERKRRQEIVRKQYKRKSISSKYPHSLFEVEQQDVIKIPQGSEDLNNDDEKKDETIVTDAASKEVKSADIVDNHCTLSTSDIEAGKGDSSNEN